MLLRELYTWREAQDLRSTLSHGKLNMALGLLRWEFLWLSCHVNVFFVLVLTVRCGSVPFPPTQNSHREKTHGTWCLSAGNYLVRGACFCDLENILTRTLRRDKEKPIHSETALWHLYILQRFASLCCFSTEKHSKKVFLLLWRSVAASADLRGLGGVSSLLLSGAAGAAGAAAGAAVCCFAVWLDCSYPDNWDR